jgi:hypothetical protein
MPDINEINGLVLCDEINVNGVIIANITNIDGITKSCAECNEIILSVTRGDEPSCEDACSRGCDTYYTNAPGVPITGDYIYQSSICSCTGQPALNYYSNKCGLRSGKCFTINGSCQITGVSIC